MRLGPLEFACPPEWKVAARPTLDESQDIFVTRSEAAGERCLLLLRLRDMPHFPAMDRMKPFATSAYDTHIGGARARRIDPPEAQLPGTSEGILELGDGQTLRRVHFQYANLDAPTRQAVELVLTTLRTPKGS